MGNAGSVVNMLRRVGVEAAVTSDPSAIAAAEKLILPGVGAFSVAMGNLTSLGLVEPLHEAVVERQIPTFGICLGMQLFASFGEEGGVSGLGWIPGRVVKLEPHGADGALPVPHIGWGTVEVRKPSRLYAAEPPEARYYFVHSYHYVCDDPADVLTTTTYGQPFVSSVERGNIAGVQFHPEKSHKAGLQLLANFVGSP